MNQNKVIQHVKQSLDNVGHGITFDLIAAGIRREDSWWYVPVLAMRKGKDVPREITVNIFANIEDELEREQNLNVLLVPAVAESTLKKNNGRRGHTNSGRTGRAGVRAH